MKAVILAGGYGKRLRPLTDTVPKALLQIAGKAIVERQIEWLRSHGVNEIIMCVGYLKEKIIESISSGQRLNVKVGYVVEDEPLGTAGALKNAEHLLRSERAFLVINGDVLTDIDPISLTEVLDNYVGAVAVVPLPSPYGIVKYDMDEYRIIEFKEKPIIEEYWINAGVYAFSSEVFKYLPLKGELEFTTFPQLSSKGLLRAVPFKGRYWKSIDSQKDLEEADAYFRSNTK
jgi:NDP-sugar pyrophosphorylase family protein